MLVERDLQVTIGTPLSHSRVSDLQWRLRTWYLFQEPLSADFIHFKYMLARGYSFLFPDSVNSDCQYNEDGGGERLSMLDSSSDFGTGRLDGPESIWDVGMVQKHWSQRCGKKLLCAFNATRIEALLESQTWTLLNLADPLSAAASQNAPRRLKSFQKSLSRSLDKIVQGSPRREKLLKTKKLLPNQHKRNVHYQLLHVPSIAFLSERGKD